jgi:hypothetical protein
MFFTGTAWLLRYGPLDPKGSSNSRELMKSVALVRERTIPTERQPLAGEVNENLCGYMGCRVVSAAESYSRNLSLLDRSRYFFFQVAPQF